jgi:threonine dehydratase
MERMQSTWENVAEPSGAATVAAALAGAGAGAGPVVASISGGNIALEKLPKGFRGFQRGSGFQVPAPRP